MSAVREPRRFPAGCTITNIRPGEGARSAFVYASLRGPDGGLLIAATLQYINEQLTGAIIEDAAMSPHPAPVSAERKS